MSRIRTCVVKVPAGNDWRTRHESCPRDLLPWADPYIAQLICRLEDRFDDHFDRCDPFAADHAPWNADAFDDGWREDAFMPRPLDAPRFQWLPSVYGGYPLLDDES